MTTEKEKIKEGALKLLRELEADDRREIFATLKKEKAQQEEDKKQQENLSKPNSYWSKAHLLKKIPNPSKEAYEQKLSLPEITFIGAASQPDFGSVLLTFYPNEFTIELKSLKQYKDAFRDSMASYERLANVMFEDLMTVYQPKRLRLVMQLRPRGGISSCLTIDSDWKIRGGKEEFNDWKQDVLDRFGFSAEDHEKI